MPQTFIDTPEQLETLCNKLKGSPWLALDTEFIRDKTYYPRLCLLQVSNGNTSACVDPIAIVQLDPLLELIYDPQITKVFHAARQDLEIFLLRWQRLPEPLFDTQLAATLLGLGDQVGYGTLVQQQLDTTLEKGQARTDWAQRPLEAAQLSYALDDVVYLGPLYLNLLDQLKRLGRENWLQEDFKELGLAETYQAPDESMWQKIKGHQKLKGVQLSVLQALAAWREVRARESDRPRRWIIKDEPLLEIARRQPKQLPQLERIRGLEAGLLKRWGATLLDLVSQAQSLPQEAWPKTQQLPKRLSPNQEAQCDLMMAALRLLAEEQHISHSALAGRRDLERLAKGEKGLQILHGWRKSLAGQTLTELLQGRRQLLMLDGRLQLTQIEPDA